jgi:aspartyl-tRNA(Asn)/glutamyl-tRNA(Gln) amidotransferase subunit A
MVELWTHLPTAVEASQQLRAGEITPSQLVAQSLARIERLDPTLKAWVAVQRDAPLPLSDSPQGLLAGIPVGIKDIIDVAGIPTKAGCEAEVVADVEAAPSDAPIVAALRSAGAVILGKTATCQFACFDPAPTLNPWHLERTPGGSSAGSAVAVAVGECAIALGTQTGGSILRPASYCGICGFKPAHDTRWLEGVAPVSARLDHVGPLARSVNDLLLTWRAVAGPASAAYGRRLSQPPRIGVLKEYFWEQSSESMRQATDAAVTRLSQAGAACQEVALPPGFREVHFCHHLIMAHDCARQHAARFRAFPTMYQPKLAALLREGLEITASNYAAAVDFQRMFRLHLYPAYPEVDVLLMPTTATTAPARDTTGDPRFQSPWSFAGVPAVTLPSGLADDGLPCGLQLVQPHGGKLEQDFELLAIAAWCEACLELDLTTTLSTKLQQLFPHENWILP